MRILQVTDTLQPGGAERVAVDLANFLLSKGHQVFFCATRMKGALEEALDPGIFITCLNRTSTFSGLYKFRKYVLQNRIEIVHAHGSSSAQFCILSLLGLFSVKIILHDHNSVLEKRNHFLQKITLGRVYQWIVVSKPIYEWVIEKAGFKNPRLILNPINTHRFKMSADALTQPVTIVALANYRVEKHYENLIEVARLAKQENLNIQLNCYGSHYNSEYFMKIKALCESNQLQGFVRLNPPTMAVPDLLKAANLGILFSLHEGLPISLLEYMACALPVVVTDVGDCGEIVRNSGCGEVVPTNDPAAFINSIKRLIASPERSIMGANGRKYVDQYHSIEAFGEKIVNEVYSQA